jgi:hypothetical protein
MSVGWLVGPGAACKNDKSDDTKATAAAQTPALVDPAARTTAEPRPVSESKHEAIFFEVVSPTGAKNWILGTMHLGFDYQELPAVVWTRLGEANGVVLEADMRTMEQVARERMTLPEGHNLETLLGPTTWARLRTELPQIEVDQLRAMPPWMISSILLARLFPTALPVDMAVLREAERGHKDLVFLEDMGWQADLLADVMGPKAVAELLDEKSAMRRLLAEGAAAYQRGDFDALAGVALDPAALGGDEALLDRMIFARNARWFPQLETAFGKGGTFVAVGAAHLAGDKGLLHLFEAAGFTATRVAR